MSKLRRMVKGDSQSPPSTAAPSTPAEATAQAAADALTTQERKQQQQQQGSKPGKPTPDAQKREAAAQGLQDVLGLDQREGWAVLARDQGLAGLSKKQMQDRLSRLGKLMRLQPDAARTAVARLPRLLALEPKECRRRLQQFGEVVRVDDKRAVELVAQQPGLLLHSSETLRWVGVLPLLLGCVLFGLGGWGGRLLSPFST